MAALSKVLPDNLVFVQSKQMVEGLANELQREKVGCSAVGEDHDLDLDWEAPRGGMRRNGIA